MIKIWILSLVVALGTGLTARAEGPRPFLFLKTGEKFATQEIAAPTVSGLTAYIGEKVAGTTNAFEPRVMNDPVKAAEFSGKSKPALGIVTAGFYLTYAKTLGLEPLLEIKRVGVKEERCILVTRKDGIDDLAKLEGKTIATPLAGEQRYVLSVVLQGKAGEEVRLQQTMDVEGSVFDLAAVTNVAHAVTNVTDVVTNMVDAVLLETGAWDLFKDDPDSGGKLKVVYQSEELPHDLVVAFAPRSDAVNLDKLKQVLKDMNGNADGQKVLQSIRVESFADIDHDRLAKAEKLFYGK